ncbi:3-oxo-5-alpha-steroid 4-dehydrogenase family protein [Perilla frutescens var. hirtella]|nr:3-oxo-5-alpha-steroid 4-dehydrogenase family protein [Perilla frutescens var. hirtella]KAH6806338.1 3-oxo-5-alpha-steroid 4-dehydrogenase family protein [Perilla frutescens var. frutescens]
MVLSVLLKFIFPPAESVVITAMSAISLLSMSNAGLMEVKGKSMQYSKLLSSNNDKARVRGKIGMIAAYTPAFLAGTFSLFIFPHGDLRFTLLRSAITTHFFKRLFEVMFVHKYSGFMEKETMVAISVSYFLYSAIMIYCQQLMLQLPEPSIDLKYIGIPIFLVGIGGNFYHHYLLSKLRSEGEKQYRIPKGGLFSLVVCPHYLFEIIGFWGISCISQTLYSISFSLGSTLYLMGRSYATRRWYHSKFEDFPKDVKAFIPFIF